MSRPTFLPGRSAALRTRLYDPHFEPHLRVAGIPLSPATECSPWRYSIVSCTTRSFESEAFATDADESAARAFPMEKLSRSAVIAWRIVLSRSLCPEGPQRPPKLMLRKNLPEKFALLTALTWKHASGSALGSPSRRCDRYPPDRSASSESRILRYWAERRIAPGRPIQ